MVAAELGTARGGECPARDGHACRSQRWPGERLRAHARPPGTECYVGNLAPMPGVFPDYPAPVVRNTDTGREMTLMRWGMPPPPRTGGPPVL